MMITFSHNFPWDLFWCLFFRWNFSKLNKSITFDAMNLMSFHYATENASNKNYNFFPNNFHLEYKLKTFLCQVQRSWKLSFHERVESFKFDRKGSLEVNFVTIARILIATSALIYFSKTSHQSTRRPLPF